VRGSVFVECEEVTCVYHASGDGGRCIAERISITIAPYLECDTYENRELAYDPQVGMDAIDWGLHDDWGDRD